MLRIHVVSQEEYDSIWNKLQPQMRFRCDIVDCDALIIRDSNGPIVVMAGGVEVITAPPERLTRLLQVAFEKHKQQAA